MEISVKLYINLVEKFDIIFLDPPYDRGWIEKASTAILQKNILAKDGVLVVETSAKNRGRLIMPPEWRLIKESKYGDTTVMYLTF
jgi:16S rRNA (guanine966-N2)-methyltransferase